MQLLDGLLQDIPSLILARHPWLAPRCSPQISLPVKSAITIRSWENPKTGPQLREYLQRAIYLLKRAIKIYLHLKATIALHRAFYQSPY